MKKFFAFCLMLVSLPVIASCPPGTVARGVYTKYCYPVATSSSSGGGGGGYGGAGAQLGQQIGTAVGGLLREALFGNPQQNAERQAALAAQRQWEEQERARLAAERARQDEERYQRLRTSLLDFSSGPQLTLMGTQSSGGLQLMLGDAAEHSSSPAFADLTRAAIWSTLAASADTPENAAALAEAAFQSALGAQVNLPPPPPDVKGVPVGPLIKDFDPLKKEYLEIRKDLPDAVKPVLDAEYRRELATHAEEEALAAERAVKTAAQKAQAREALEQARRMRRQAEADLLLARSQLDQKQARANGVEQGLRDLLASTAAAGRQGTGPANNAFYKGYQDGSLCFSQSAGNFCQQPAAKGISNCEGNYRLGYSAGEKVKAQVLQDARDRGRTDKLAGRNYADTDPRAQGPCRYEYVMAYNSGYFSARVSLLASAPSSTRTDVPLPPSTSRGPRNDAERLREGVISYAQRLGWTDEEQKRVREAIAAVPFGENEGGSYVPAKILLSWGRIEERVKAGGFAAIAAKGEGPNLYGAGLQGYNDCVIYAVAAASGRPYGVVAAEANKMIREGGWRTQSDWQKVFGPGGGLYAEEVIMLAEGFGQARVVKPADFANTLKSGRPVLVNVVPQSGDISAAHQIVLAKTFRYRGETWYEAIDSNFGPLRRLYMNHGELDALLHDNGIAYLPEPGTTVKFLRNPTASR